MAWGCFPSSGPGWLAVINETMNPTLYQKILKGSGCQFVTSSSSALMQQDSDPKHTSKSTSEWIKKEQIKVLKQPNKSLDLNPIEMLWHDLKQSLHAWKPSNICIKTILLRRVGQFSLPVIIANAWLQLLLERVAQPLIRFRGQLRFHVGPGRFG